ncbi:MAG: SPOR domain-containing protein [Desulfobacula sp.]|uniref:SPOR domain-containing protein n=1 Tax=Desulfobacula sp. TaxID=2593537 RepID=UPI0025BE3DE7|nr:SPOR domain-containing protein [Desulfobacula sp.]MCD4722887.1 SPOR domain-containing protein [Desulfobacula sp.]
MIWILRNIGIHLWITTLITIPLSFYILPGISRLFPGINPITTGLVTIMGVVVAIGFLMDGMAKKALTDLLKEGQAWERSGIHHKAEKNYIKALRMYDTFLLWPFSAGKTARIISGTVAKFKLNTAIENQNFKLGTAVYLKMNPADEDIARLWLEQLRRYAIVTSFEQEVLSALAEKHYANKRLSPLMIDIFLALERKDYIAKKLYQHVRKDSVFEEKYSTKIQDMIGRPDETLQQEVSYIKPEKKFWQRIEPGKNIQTAARRCVSYLKSSWMLIGSILSFLILSVGRVSTYVKEHEKAQFYLKAGFLLIVSVWLGFFMINTMSHMFKSRAVEKEKIETQIQVPKPFTIQVAAYLKQKHADRYVDILKKKGIDAIVKKVDGGGKTWFVVRVSEFIDKKSATAYGRKLVQQKIIDDFFVNNK